MLACDVTLVSESPIVHEHHHQPPVCINIVIRLTIQLANAIAKQVALHMHRRPELEDIKSGFRTLDQTLGIRLGVNPMRPSET